jgi:hypothetical protein
LLRLVKSAAKICTCREEYNKYDMTRAPCFWLANHNDWSRWFAVSSSHLFAVPISVLRVALGKSKQLNLDVKNIFCRITYWAPVGML